MCLQHCTLRMRGLSGDEGNRTKTNGLREEMLQEATKNMMDTKSYEH